MGFLLIAYLHIEVCWRTFSSSLITQEQIIDSGAAIWAIIWSIWMIASNFFHVFLVLDTVLMNFRSFKLSKHHFLHFLFCSPLSPVHGLTHWTPHSHERLSDFFTFLWNNNKSWHFFFSLSSIGKEYAVFLMHVHVWIMKILCFMSIFFLKSTAIILNATVHIHLVGLFMGSSQTSCISCDRLTGPVCSPSFRLTHWTENSTLSVCQTVSCPNNRPQGCV